MSEEIDKLHSRIRQLEDELMRVRADAAASVFFWGEFASSWSKAHWDLNADITRLRGPVPLDVVLDHPQAPEPRGPHRGALGAGVQAPAGRRG